MQMIRQKLIRAGISRTGDSWKFRWDETVVILPPQRGFFYLSLLVVRPNQEISCDDLYATACGTSMLADPREPVVDRATIRDFKASDDPAAKAFLANHTFRGKALPRGRARQNVCSSIQYSLKTIQQFDHLRDAYAHLSRTMTYGVRVAYYPSSDRPRCVSW